MSDPSGGRPVRERGRGAAVAALAELPVPALLVDRRGRVVEGNPAAWRLLGSAAAADLPGCFDKPQAARRLLERAADGMTTAGGDLALAGADLRWVRVAASAAAGGVLVLLDDLTALVRRVDEEARGRQEAEDAMRAKMRFFAAASHDLRQPLQAIALFVGALEPRVTAPPAQPILQSIKTSLGVMEDMFEALLDMSRLEAGVLEAEPRDFMIGDILEALETEFAPQVKPGVELRVVPSSQAVRSDPGLLARIGRNLLANAVRYTDRGRILVGCRRRGADLRLEVWDTGCGIPEHQRLAIFEEFYRGTHAGGPCHAVAGLGLGLSIVQGLARLLRHRLDVRSQIDRGSMFAVEVPLAEGPAAVEDADEAVAPPNLAGCSVLVIDDDEDILEGVRLLLSEWGCRVVVAPDGEAAVAAVRAEEVPPDVVLADLRLRGGDGVAAARRVMDALDAWVPTVVLTGATEEAGAVQLAGRPLTVLRKPVEPVRLARVLRRAIVGD